MVPWLLVFSECYKMQDSFENTENFHSKVTETAAAVQLPFTWRIHAARQGQHTEHFCENVADEASL